CGDTEKAPRLRVSVSPCLTLIMSVEERLLRRELIDRRRRVPLSGLEHGRREVRLVRRVREVLRLKAKTITTNIDLAAFAGDRAVQEIACVELDARLGRGDF